MFRKRIQNVYANLSPSNQRVARYILDHYHEAAFMSANQRETEDNTEAPPGAGASQEATP